MTSASTRRAALGAILGASLTSGAVMALPAKDAQLGHPSDLARACDWAIAHVDWINHNDEPLEAWPDERVNAECLRVDDVLQRIADEPARNRDDLRAKARLLLMDWSSSLDGHSLNAAEQALMTFLREVASCA